MLKIKVSQSVISNGGRTRDGLRRETRETMVKLKCLRIQNRGITFDKGLGRAAFDSKGVLSDEDRDGSVCEVSVLLIFWLEFA